MTDRVERLTNLLALLLETPIPLSLVEIAGELAGQYPEEHGARRAAFERDKAAFSEDVRALGLPSVAVLAIEFGVCQLLVQLCLFCFELFYLFW